MTETQIAQLRVKGPRRIAAIGALVLLGALVLALATTEGLAPLGRLVLVAVSALALYGAYSVAQATREDLVLTHAGLSDGAGRVIAPMENIEAVELGLFAVKPPSGFAIKLKSPMAFGWAPGVWWRLGRRVGVGGAIAAADAKALAQVMALAIADRDRG